MAVGCGWCDKRGGTCQDCVVTVVGPPGAARHLGTEEVRALGVLADAGMIPPLRRADTTGAVISLPKRQHRNEVVGVKRTA